MIYELRIEGGFTGIPKQYRGNLDISEDEFLGLAEIMKKAVLPADQRLRDSFIYHLKLREGADEVEAQYNETNMPKEIRGLLQKITSQIGG